MRPLLEVLRHSVQRDLLMELRRAILRGAPIGPGPEHPHGIDAVAVHPLGKRQSSGLGRVRDDRHGRDGSVDCRPKPVRIHQGGATAAFAKPNRKTVQCPQGREVLRHVHDGPPVPAQIEPLRTHRPMHGAIDRPRQGPVDVPGDAEGLHATVAGQGDGFARPRRASRIREGIVAHGPIAIACIADSARCRPPRAGRPLVRAPGMVQVAESRSNLPHRAPITVDDRAAVTTTKRGAIPAPSRLAPPAASTLSRTCAASRPLPAHGAWSRARIDATYVDWSIVDNPTIPSIMHGQPYCQPDARVEPARIHAADRQDRRIRDDGHQTEISRRKP